MKNINQLALILGLLDEEDAVVSREDICSLCNVCCAAVTSSLQIIRCCWKLLAQYCFHGTLRPSSCIRVAVHVDTLSPEGRSKSLGEDGVELIVLTSYHWVKHKERR